jgi:hypothetical protein
VPSLIGIHPYQRLDRRAIAEALGVSLSRYWQQGVIRVRNDLLLFVTLDKSSLPPEYRYTDPFSSAGVLHWESQNQDSRDGRGSIDGMAQMVAVSICSYAERPQAPTELLAHSSTLDPSPSGTGKGTSP